MPINWILGHKPQHDQLCSLEREREREREVREKIK